MSQNAQPSLLVVDDSCACALRAVWLQSPTQDAVIDPVRGVTKKEGHSPGHKIQMRTSEQVRASGAGMGRFGELGTSCSMPRALALCLTGGWLLSANLRLAHWALNCTCVGSCEE